jgi:hypothetical protein
LVKLFSVIRLLDCARGLFVPRRPPSVLSFSLLPLFIPFFLPLFPPPPSALSHPSSFVFPSEFLPLSVHFFSLPLLPASVRSSLQFFLSSNLSPSIPPSSLSSLSFSLPFLSLLVFVHLFIFISPIPPSTLLSLCSSLFFSCALTSYLRTVVYFCLSTFLSLSHSNLPSALCCCSLLLQTACHPLLPHVLSSTSVLISLLFHTTFISPLSSPLVPPFLPL